jgi:hypothetical protein
LSTRENCTLDCMVLRRGHGEIEVMAISDPATQAPREPDNELYDRGCDLVEAAAAIRRTAGSPRAVRAVPAILGCIECALEELLWASALLEETTAQSLGERSGHGKDLRRQRRSDRMHHGYANLQQALADAERAASAARSLAQRVLARNGSS